MSGRRIVPKVYLEGFEIPAYAITIQTSIGAPAVATIDAPPHESFFDRVEEDPPKSGTFVRKPGVLPRSLVHVFYEDSEDPDGLPRLLFEGEFVRYEYVKTEERRVLRIFAKDLSNLLSSIYVRYYGDFLSPYGSFVSAFAGNGTAEAGRQNLVMGLINTATGLNPEILKILQNDKLMVGIAAGFKEIVTNAIQVNTFFGSFDRRTNITKKIVALPDGTSRLLLEATQLAAILQQNMSNLKEFQTVWDLYSMLMSLVFYFPVPISSAPFIANPITEFGQISVRDDAGAITTKRSSSPFTVSPGKTLASLLLKPYTWWSSPPTFNVIFPSQYKSFTMGRDFLSEPTRLMVSAFGVIESLSAQELQRLLPSQFMFLAPSVLTERFNKEIFDSTVQPAFRIVTAEKELQELKDQKNKVSASSQKQGLSKQEQESLKSQQATIDANITAKEAELAQREKEAAEKTRINKTDPAQADSRILNRSVLTVRDGVSLSSREDLKGIVFAFDYMTQTQVEVTKSKAIQPDALQDYLSNVAAYKLSLQQHKNRISQITMHFHPQLVVGFPTLVIDPNRNFFGEIEMVTHVLDAVNAAADTQVQVSFLRNDEIEFPEEDRNGIGETKFPQWINPKYLPQNIGENVYKVLFPANRPDPSKPGVPAADAISPAFGKNQVAAAKSIRKLYFNAKDPVRFASAFTRRNIATADQVMIDSLGAVKVGKNYVFADKSDDRFLSAQAYAKAVSGTSILAVSEKPEEVRA